MSSSQKRRNMEERHQPPPSAASKGGPPRGGKKTSLQHKPAPSTQPRVIGQTQMLKSGCSNEAESEPHAKLKLKSTTSPAANTRGMPTQAKEQWGKLETKSASSKPTLRSLSKERLVTASEETGGQKSSSGSATTSRLEREIEVTITLVPRLSNCMKKASRKARELDDLRRENTSLKQELSEVKTLYEQLVHEATSERLEERRVHLLKSQIFQLERQIVLQTRALSGRAELLLELQNMLDCLLAKLSALSKVEGGGPSHEADEVISTAKMLRGRIARCSQTSSSEHLAQPLMFMEKFIKPSRQRNSENPVTLLDVCIGSTEHLNLIHVGRLESTLADLYGELKQLQASLETVPVKSISMFQPAEDHLTGHVTKCCKMIGECCHDLLCLSILVPTAPWPPRRNKEVSLDFKADYILERLPPFLRNKKEGREIIEAAAKSFNYHNHMQEMKCKALEEELKFHKDVYELQIGYVESLFEAMRNGYQTFEDSAQELICKPLEAILSAYCLLSHTASDDTLRTFLLTVQQNEQQLKMAMESLRKPHKQGREAFSQFGQHFFESLHELKEDFTKRRREELGQRDAQTST